MVTKQEQMQQVLVQAQSLQQQMQVISAQRESLNLQMIEMGKALEEVSKPSKEEIYKIVGPVLVKTERAKAKKDLEQKKDIITLRLKTLEKTESKIKEQLEEIKNKIS